MAPRKNTKSASTPAPVADSKITKAYTGRKTRAMKAAEEKDAAEAGNTAVHANVTATKAVKAVKATTKTKTKTKAVKLVEPADMPLKQTTLNSASNALKALRGAPKTNQNTKPQREINAELTKFQAQQARKPHLWDTQVAPVRPDDMASDFEAMGFGADKVKELVAMKEPVKVDGLAQRSVGGGLCVPFTGPEPPKRVRKPRGQGKYENLVVFEDRGKSLLLPTASIVYIC